MPAPKGNKFAIGNSGKPKYWKTPEELQSAIDEYFIWCDMQKRQVYDKQKQKVVDLVYQVPYTIEGLCEILECDRHTLLNYEKTKGYEEYFTIIKKAKIKIQRNKLERGLTGESNPAVTIFDLKNNHKYKDKQEFEHSGELKSNIIVQDEETKKLLNDLIKGD
jgi:hypothetical protein